MDFDEDDESGGSSRPSIAPTQKVRRKTDTMSGSQISTSSASVSSSQQTRSSSIRRVSIRGQIKKKKKERIKNEDDDDSIASTVLTMKIRGAGASTGAIQDAGTMQMLQDECQYLCSAILASTSPQSTLESALELATMLSNKKTRRLLWQSHQGVVPSTPHSSDGSTPVTMPFSSSPKSLQAVEHKCKDVIVKTALDSVLDVLAIATIGARSQKSRKSASAIINAATTPLSTPQRQQHSNFQTNQTATSSSIRTGRTKSARRKLQEQQQHQQNQLQLPPSQRIVSETASTGRHVSTNVLTLELGQVLATIAYLLSMDCTMSKTFSASTLPGTVPNPRLLAQSVRLTILKHPKALQGIFHLCLLSSSSNDKVHDDTKTFPTMTPPGQSKSIHGPPMGNTSVDESSTLSQSSGISFHIGHNNNNKKKKYQKRIESQWNASPFSNSVSSVSFLGDDDKEDNHGSAPNHNNNNNINHHVDPTKLGRLNRRRRRQQQQHVLQYGSTLPLTPVMENDPNNNESHHSNGSNALDWNEPNIIPPPTKRTRMTRTRRTIEDVSLSFTSNEDGSEMKHEAAAAAAVESDNGSNNTFPVPSTPHRSISSSVSIGTNLSQYTTGPWIQKLQKLRSHVHFTCSLQNQTLSQQQQSMSKSSATKSDNNNNDDDTAWISLLCLESVQRIITGKEGEETSCLEPTDNDDDDNENIILSNSDEEHCNPILYTNELLGKAGVIPLMAQCMIRALQGVVGGEFVHPIHETGNGLLILKSPGSDQDKSLSFIAPWRQQERIGILASLIDGACLLHQANRREFVEPDPFSFETQTKEQGLVYHILWFLSQDLKSNTHWKTNEQATPIVGSSSSVRLWALRTLTSLTHDNDVAAEQVMESYDFFSDMDQNVVEDKSVSDDIDDDDDDKNVSKGLCGVEVLTRLIFVLETMENSNVEQENSKGKSRHSTRQKMTTTTLKEDHHYDSTIFCLNTLANIIETPGARKILSEILVPFEVESNKTKNKRQTKKKKKTKQLWLEWLCQWLIDQTKGFRDSILSIGNKDADSQHSQRELEKSEEEKLVAAGNGCVLLACLMSEPENLSEEPETTNRIRELILDQMSTTRKDRSSKSGGGLTLIINTLKAFCNFYHFSLGELSVAVIAPVKKLIDQLAELQEEFEEK